MIRFYIFQALTLFALPVVAEPQARPKATAADVWARWTREARVVAISRD